MKTAVIIPARYASTRFPGKSLAPVGGKPLIRQVWERARECRRASRVVVATDDERIREAVSAAGGDVMMTEGEFRTGTDRLAWIAERVEADAYLNLQGDEFIQDGRILDDLIAQFENSQPLEMGTLKRPALPSEDRENPNIVKVVTDREGYALYFSRAPIPYRRDRDSTAGGKAAPFEKHLGIYIYQKDTLKKLAGYPTGVLEDFEKLEQLRALENGIRIRVWDTVHESLRIDAPEDIRSAEHFLVHAGSKGSFTS
jgi:3-deoxy-manno-octulosonate cytidylyltransferase (CMP-KDO synthetase)